MNDFIRSAVILSLFTLSLYGCGGDDSPPATPSDAALSTPDSSIPDASIIPDAEPRPDPFVGPTGPSAGCGNAEAPRGSMTRTLVATRIEREFILVVPDGYDPETPVALVFAWHGLGDSAAGFSRGLSFESESRNDAIVVYPHGRPALAGANGWDITAGGRDVDFFDAMLDELSSAYCIDTSRIFSMGFSYGGFFSNTLGCARGDVIRAIGPIGAAPTARSGCQGQVAAMIIHGEADATISFALGESARDLWTGKNGCSAESSPATPSACVAQNGCDEGYPVLWCTHSGGHVFPSWGRSALWNFFNQF